MNAFASFNGKGATFYGSETIISIIDGTKNKPCGRWGETVTAWTLLPTDVSAEVAVSLEEAEEVNFLETDADEAKNSSSSTRAAPQPLTTRPKANIQAVH